MKRNILTLVVDNTRRQEDSPCLWKILDRFRDECLKCDSTDPCLIEAVLQPAEDEMEFPVFLKQIRERLNGANKIWGKIRK